MPWSTWRPGSAAREVPSLSPRGIIRYDCGVLQMINSWCGYRNCQEGKIRWCRRHSYFRAGEGGWEPMTEIVGTTSRHEFCKLCFAYHVRERDWFPQIKGGGANIHSQLLSLSLSLCSFTPFILWTCVLCLKMGEGGKQGKKADMHCR